MNQLLCEQFALVCSEFFGKFNETNGDFRASSNPWLHVSSSPEYRAANNIVGE
jgi:hypothetical protein